ncbi:MAG: AI-2E family transporter [Oscillospiraceae bacterium]
MKIEKNDKYITIAAYALGVILISILAVMAIFKFSSIATVLTKILSVLSPLFIGLVLAYILNPIMMFIEKKIISRVFKKAKRSHKRMISTVLTILVFIGIIAGLLSFVIPEIIDSVSSLAVNIPQYAGKIKHWIEVRLAENEAMLDYFTKQIDQITSYLSNISIADKIYEVIATVTSSFIGIANAVINLFIGMIISIYLLLDKEKLMAQTKKVMYAMLPKKPCDSFFGLTSKINDIFMGSIVSKLVDSLIVGIICFIGMMIFRMPYPVLISVIIGITNLIPYFGPFIGTIPSAFLIVLVDPLKMIWFVVFMIVLQQIDGNLIFPKLQGDLTGLSPLWALLAITIGGEFFGIVGMLVSVPVFAVIYLIAKIGIENLLRKKALPVDTADYRIAEKQEPVKTSKKPKK